MDTITIFMFIFGGVGIITAAVFSLRRIIAPGRIAALEDFLANGNSKAVIKQAKAILSRNEKNAEAHWYLGEAYRLEKRFDMAVAEYKYIAGSGKYSVICPERKVREALAHSYLKIGHLDESQKEFILLSKLDPNNYEHFYHIAELFEQRNYTDSALSNYKKAVKLNPKHAQSYQRIGVILFQKKLLNEAKKVFAAVLRLEPQNSAPFYYLGKISQLMGDVEGAMSQFEKAQRDPELRQRALFERAQVYFGKGDTGQAIVELERALKGGEEDQSMSLHLRYLLAKCYEAQKDIVRAVEQWEKVYEKNPKYKDVAEKLASYGEVRTDDRLKDFLIAQQDKFQEYCVKIVEAMGLTIQDILPKSQDLIEVSALETQSKWRNAKKAPSIIRFYRGIEPISYETIRAFYDQMRRMNATRAICISASKFTRTAVEFAQIRPIELVDKEELTKLLARIQN